MKLIYTASALGLAVLLGACGSKTPSATPSAASNAETNSAMSGMAPSGAMAKMDNMSNMASSAAIESTMAKATGKVTAIDPAAGTVTIAHSAIPEVKWPAMTMTFKADPKLLSGVAAGDQVTFDLTVKGSEGEVTAIKKQ